MRGWLLAGVAVSMLRSAAWAEDAAEAISVEFKELPVVVDIDSAREAGADRAASTVEDNLC